MPIEAKEVPKIVFLIFLIGLSSYAAVWVAGKIRDEVSATARS